MAVSLGPSPHLSWEELACHDGTAYPEAWRADRAVVLARVFEGIRTACGRRPVTVLSAYRTPAHNRAVGGSKGSQHLQGRALDLIHETLDAQAFGDVIRKLAATTCPEIGGVGQYASFVHVDIRPREHPGQIVTWEG